MPDSGSAYPTNRAGPAMSAPLRPRKRARERPGGGRGQAATQEIQPDARAMSNLALIHESGKWGRHRDDAMALKLYRRAGCCETALA
jgi:hypothetical protein